MTKKKGTPKRKKTAKKKAPKLTYTQKLERQVRSLQKRVAKYERQQFQGPLLPTQKRKPPTKTKLAEIRGKLKLFLEKTKSQLELQDIGGHYRSYENADGSIDAVFKVPLDEGMSAGDVLIELEDAARWNQELDEFWIRVGVNVGSEELTGSPTIDRRPHLAYSNPVRGDRAGAAFFTTRETVIPKLEEHGGDISQVVIRLQWHPYNDRPIRRHK